MDEKVIELISAGFCFFVALIFGAIQMLAMPIWVMAGLLMLIKLGF